MAGVLGRAMSARKCRAAPSGQGRRRPSERAATKTSPQAETRRVVTDPIAAKGTWCSGITSASHAEGPGFKSQCVHFTPSAPPLGEEMLDPGRTRTCNLWFRRPTPYPLGHRATGHTSYSVLRAQRVISAKRRNAQARSYADLNRDRWIQSPECWPLHHRTDCVQAPVKRLRAISARRLALRRGHFAVGIAQPRVCTAHAWAQAQAPKHAHSDLGRDPQ